MKGLVIVDSIPRDKTLMAQYSEQAAKTLDLYGGKFLIKGAIETLHGEASHLNKAVIEFPDKKTAQNWYNSSEYQALIPLRNRAMDSQFHLVG